MLEMLVQSVVRVKIAKDRVWSEDAIVDTRWARLLSGTWTIFLGARQHVHW